MVKSWLCSRCRRTAAQSVRPVTRSQRSLVNTGSADLKYLGISDKPVSDVCEYPDSRKFAVTSRFDWSNPAAGGVRYVGRAESAVDYFDGEK